MKKRSLFRLFGGLTICIAFCDGACAFTPSEAFENKLEDCSSFREESSNEFFGMQMKTVYEIIGKKDGKCVFSTLNITDFTETLTTCAMDGETYEKLKKAAAEDQNVTVETKTPLYAEVDGRQVSVGTSTVSGSPKQIFWQTLFADPKICTAEVKERDIESEILAALENCTPTKKEFGIFGMGMLIKFAPSSKKEGYCDFLQRVSFPPVTATVNDVQKETPATTKETRCRLSFDKMKELVQRLKNSQETDEENKTFIPKEWLENPELCASREFQTPPQKNE